MIETKEAWPPTLDEFDPEESRKIPIGIDVDGVIVKKAKSWDLPRRATKILLRPMPGVKEAIESLQEMEDVGTIDIRTVRPDWLRTRQTRRQLNRMGLGDLHIIHTNNSYVGKMTCFLFESVAYADRNGFARSPRGLFLPRKDIERVVLIDDSYLKIVKAIKKIHLRSWDLDLLINKFVLFAFGHDQEEINQSGETYDPEVCFQPLQNVHTLMLKHGDEEQIGVPIIGVEDWDMACDAVNTVLDLPENFNSTHDL